MANVLLLSLNILEPRNKWPSLAHAIICALNRLGFSLTEICKTTTAPRLTIKDILH